jgi:signal recognition particle GTPase
MFGGTMALPQLTDAQRKEALEKAAQARHARAELREKIKSGKVTLQEVLDSDDPIASRMKVSTLIESLPGYGKAKAAKIMDELGISSTRRVKGLGARQREQLLEALKK